MNVLMQNRIDTFDKPGGDTQQLLKTKSKLEKLGVKVDISLDYTPVLDAYDLVHLFNTTRIHETWMQFKNAKRQQKPVVLSTIYHDYTEFNQRYSGHLRCFVYRNFSANSVELIKETARAFLKYPKQFKALQPLIYPGYMQAQKTVICNVDCLLPQSHMDIEMEKRIFNLSGCDLNYKKVVNGVDIEKFNSHEFLVDDYPELEHDSFVLCAARIEPVKNQLNLIRSLKGANLKLVLVGAVNKYHKKYAAKVLAELKEIGGIYLGFVNDQQLIQLYKKARVHVLASWFETCGLSSLEAGYAGANVVASDRGYTTEYLKDFAWYCKPDNLSSIKMAIAGAYSAPRKRDFSDFIESNYTWDKAAMQTKAAYESVLNGPPASLLPSSKSFCVSES